MPKREREPELKEISMAYEINLNEMDSLTIELRNKVRSIHNPPQTENANKALCTPEIEDKTDDLISDLSRKNKRLETYNKRLAETLQALSRIV